MELIDFAVRYPFTNAAREILKIKGVSINERLADIAVERIITSLSNIVKKTAAIHESEKLEEIASYAVARMILAHMRNTYITTRYAISESKRAASYLSTAQEEEFDNITKQVGVVAVKKGNEFVLPLPIYLKNCPKSIDYRLVNRNVAHGLVSITRQELVRLVEEAIRQHIEKIPIIKDAKEEIKNAAKCLVERLPKFKQPITYAQTTSQLHPPCIETLMEEVRQHKNLPHQARWLLAVYFIKKGMGEKQLCEVFSMFPDYNKKITKYQVTHAQAHDYSVPSCATILSYGLCVAQCGIKNPLQYKGKKK